MSTPDNLAPSVAILRRYYGCVKGLQSYLAHILAIPDSHPDPDELLKDDHDLQSYINLLSSSYVGVKDFKLSKKFQVSTPMLDMREV